jgi:hypothetical protein
MKPTKSLVIAALIASAFSATAANAFNLSGGLGGSSSSSSSSDTATDNLAAQDALVKSFVASQVEVLTAQSLLAQAYGLKDQAELCNVQAKALQNTGVDTDTLKKTVDISNQANDLITAQQTKETTLSDQEKQYYVQSLPHFAKGIIGTHDLVTKAATFTSSLKSAGTSGAGLLTMGAAKLKSGMFIAKSTPEYSKNLYDVFRKTVTIGQNNGIKAPADATSALGALN